MIVTFPHLGPLSLALQQIFNALEIPCIVPPDNGREALETGGAISPEEMCIPFKYMAGNLKAAWEAGADTAVMVATCGPCRLGEYGQLLKEILQKEGCTYHWILLDSPTAVDRKELARRLRTLTEERGISYGKLMAAALRGAAMIFRMDALRGQATARAGYLKKPHDAIQLLHETEKKLKEANSFKHCFQIIKKAEHTLKELPLNPNAAPVKVLVVGEIYTSIEAEANGNLEEKLMRLGCSVKRHIDISWWLKYSIVAGLIPEKFRQRFLKKEGILYNVGGYGRETFQKILGSAAFDGVIKIMPAGCMPEIITKACCEKMQENSAHRILHLIYDEMRGDAGYDTRVEAFTDMLERRKNVLDGDRHWLN